MACAEYAVEAVTRQPLAKPWRRDEDYSSEEDDSVQHVAVQEKRVTGKWQSTPAKLSSHKFFFAADDKRISGVCHLLYSMLIAIVLLKKLR